MDLNKIEEKSDKIAKVLIAVVLITSISPFVLSFSKSMTKSPLLEIEKSESFEDLFESALEKSKESRVEINPIFMSHGESFQEFQGIIIEGPIFETSQKGIRVQSEGYYFNPMNLRELSNANAEFLDRKLKGSNLEGLGQSFIDAESLYGVNAIFLTGLAIHESNFAQSRIAQDKNNLFGMGAFDSDPYNKALTFKTMQDSILFTAGYLSREYLSEDGKYYHGYSVYDVNTRYATDQNWANAIITRIKRHVLN